ncbi:hypothetical protein [Microbispora rosea]|uniref:hypothetical protein n=1 Tax=Microbispora rosea TaxID=58117 RepID=UPI00378CA4B7
MSAATEQDVIDLLPAQHNQIKTRSRRSPPREASASAGAGAGAGAGESATANMLAGPSVAVFDEIRDTVQDWRQSNRD